MLVKDVIRGLWFFPFFSINTAMLGILSLVASLWSARRARWFGHIWARINVWSVRVNIRIEGLENIPPNQDGGLIVAANHRSAADIGVILAGLPLDVCWVTKAELLKIPFLGWHLKRVHIPVERRATSSARKFLEDGAQKIKDGAAVVVFPEGTRNRGPDILLPFKKGAFMLALASGRPVLPVAIIDSNNIWPPGSFRVRTGEVTMKIGRPIDPKQFKGKVLEHLAEETRRAIADLLPDQF